MADSTLTDAEHVSDPAIQVHIAPMSQPSTEIVTESAGEDTTDAEHVSDPAIQVHIAPMSQPSTEIVTESAGEDTTDAEHVSDPAIQVHIAPMSEIVMDNEIESNNRSGIEAALQAARSSNSVTAIVKRCTAFGKAYKKGLCKFAVGAVVTTIMGAVVGEFIAWYKK